MKTQTKWCVDFRGTVTVSDTEEESFQVMQEIVTAACAERDQAKRHGLIFYECEIEQFETFEITETKEGQAWLRGHTVDAYYPPIPPYFTLTHDLYNLFQPIRKIAQSAHGMRQIASCAVKEIYPDAVIEKVVLDIDSRNTVTVVWRHRSEETKTRIESVFQITRLERILA